MNERLKQVNHQFADPNEPAATVLLVRDIQGEGLEVFLIERAAKTNFGGAYVFPGGKVDLEDSSGRLSDMCQGVSDEDASAALGIDKGGLAYWVAVIRECFEEAGILLAYRKDGSKRLPDTTLVALTVLIAQSKPEEMETIIKVIVNLINKSIV